MGKWVSGILAAIIIVPPMLIAAAIWDINNHWKRADFGDAFFDDDDCDDPWYAS